MNPTSQQLRGVSDTANLAKRLTERSLVLIDDLIAQLRVIDQDTANAISVSRGKMAAELTEICKSFGIMKSRIASETKEKS